MLLLQPICKSPSSFLVRINIQDLRHISGIIQPTADLTASQRMILEHRSEVILSGRHHQEVLQILRCILLLYHFDELRRDERLIVFNISFLVLIIVANDFESRTRLISQPDHDAHVFLSF